MPLYSRMLSEVYRDSNFYQHVIEIMPSASLMLGTNSMLKYITIGYCTVILSVNSMEQSPSFL